MLDPEPSVGAAFDQLLSAMPRIVEVVNRFSSEENQRVALRALVRAFGVPAEPPVRGEAAEPSLSIVPPPADGQAAGHDNREAVLDAPVGAAATGRRRTRKSAAKKSWSRARDLNFRPAGKPSLRDFAAEKDPASNFEKNVVAVYYLEEVLALDAIDVGHVLAVYTECGWRSPSDPENSLLVTASRKNWLETSDMKAIRLAYQGRNTVEYDLPRASAKKSA
jgi:hypothetical protein